MTDRLSDTELETLFQQTRAVRPEPGDALMARVLEEAETHLPAAPTRAPVRGGSGGLFDGIGGWFGLGGLVAAGLAGLWIGIMPPAAVDSLTYGVLGGPVSVDASVEGLLLAAEG